MNSAHQKTQNKMLSVGFSCCLSKKNKKNAYLATYDGLSHGYACFTKLSISQVRVFQFLQFKNQSKLDIILILMMYNIGISRRFNTFSQYFILDRPLNQIFSPLKLTQLLTNQLKICFVCNIYALNLFQFANTNTLMRHLLNLVHY